MKPKTVFRLFLVLLTVFHLQVNAQVTIGNLSDPQGGALLDLKENDNVGSDNSSKGVLFPKVRLVDASSLVPLFLSPTDAQKMSSVGMVVYNVNASANGLDVGLYVWDGTQWIPTMNNNVNSGTADFTIQWASAQVNGALAKGRPLTAENTITVPVIVTKKGTYSIIARSDPNNGYYYSGTGEFLNPGTYTVTLTGMGTPQQSTNDDRKGVNDKLIININGVVVSPTPAGVPTLFVAGSTLDYSYTCSSITTAGASLEQNQSSEGVFIMIRLSMPASAIGGQYSITTNIVDGVQFSDAGTLTGDGQTVILMSNGGTPKQMGTHSFTLASNSSAVTLPTCPIDIPVVGQTISVKIVANVGASDSYDLINHGIGRLLANPELFGPASTFCPINKLSVSATSDFPTASADGSGAKFEENFDILIVSYNVYPLNITQMNAMNSFLNAGGVIIYCEGDRSNVPKNLGVTDLLLTRYATYVTNISTTSIQTGGTIALVDDPTNPIVKGKFANLCGYKVGLDDGGNRSFNLPNSSTAVGPNQLFQVIARDGTKNNYPVIFRALNAKLIVIGDAAFLAGGYSAFVDKASNTLPLKISPTDMPIPKTYSSYKDGAYNSALFVNMMIWAINELTK
ncbi:MAG: hypothetical protein FWF52_00945 [Candidatus Azobacteroides sp.]|nr:hypothetical protein [Candidatus Azobacteroides sp.]